MKILIYGLNYAPELTGIGKYTGEMASWLAKRGHDVRVVTAPPYYPAWCIREDYRGDWYRTERVPGQPVVYRTPLYVPEKPTGIKRVLHLISFMLGSVPTMLREIFWQPDVVFTIEPTFFCAPLALFVARSAGAASWLHIQDLEVNAAFDLGILPADGMIHDAALWLERSIMCSFERVSGISSKMLERTCAKGIAAERMVLFPNWVDVNMIYPLNTSGNCKNSFRRELAAQVPEIEEKILLLYSGNMGAKQGVELLAPLVEAFAQDSRVHFLFCGDGAFRPKLEKLVGKCPNVTLLPLQPYEQLNELLNAADIHLLPQRADAADLVMPSRLTGMLASGRPVIATSHRGTQVAQVVEGCGIVVPAEDKAALVTAVSRLVDDKELRLRLGCAAREYAVEHLGKHQVLAKFEIDLRALVEHE